MLLMQAAVPYGLGCSLLHTLIWAFTSQQKSIESKKVHVIVNRVVASIHALIMFSLTATYWANLRTSFWILNENLIVEADITPFQRMTIECMIGYLIYDTIVELRIGKGWMMLGHHIIGFISHILALIGNNGSAATYSMMVYLAELSTPFLHISWLLKEFGYKQSLLFLLTGMLLVLFFFVFRVLLSPYMLAHMYLHWRKDDTSMLFQLNLFVVSFFLLINYYWFYLIVQMLPLPGKKAKAKVEAKLID
jgi:hypothetical protein